MHTSVSEHVHQLDFPSAGFSEGARNPDSRETPDDLRCGAWACSKCGCTEFEGNTYQCQNPSCGHSWNDHSAIKFRDNAVQ